MLTALKKLGETVSIDECLLTTTLNRCPDLYMQYLEFVDIKMLKKKPFIYSKLIPASFEYIVINSTMFIILQSVSLVSSKLTKYRIFHY